MFHSTMMSVTFNIREIACSFVKHKIPLYIIPKFTQNWRDRNLRRHEYLIYL